MSSVEKEKAKKLVTAALSSNESNSLWHQESPLDDEDCCNTLDIISLAFAIAIAETISLSDESRSDKVLSRTFE